EAMDDDFNTPRALAAIFDLATALNRGADTLAKGGAPAPPTVLEALAGASAVLATLAGVLGLRLAVAVTPEQRLALERLAQELVAHWPHLFAAGHPLLARDEASADELIEFMASGRLQARRQRDWATSDAIRSRLQALGILLEDSPTGVTWRVR
ncbi:MAG TPA: DALR domain-containing protein, partial [bacterium]|nr:DALR domain-containing protein [bacterium]